MSRFKILLYLSFAVSFAMPSFAQLSPDSPIFQALQKADEQVFDEGFNKCRIDVLRETMHPDLQFLHDQSGIQNLEEFFKIFQENICANPAGKPIRKLVAGSMVVYPLNDDGKLYGAIQMGDHEFYMVEPGKPPRFTSSGKFIHTWLFQNNQWKLYRVVSYDHQQPVKYPPMFEDGYPFPLFNQDQRIDQLLKTLTISSVSIGYIDDGRLQQVRAFGEQKPGVPVTTETIYKVASLTKPVTAMVTLKLIDAGKWSLDEPVSEYYVDPEVKDSPYLDRLTTRRILSQQSGFPNWRYLREDKRLVFEFEPGSKFQYSGEGYEYLRKALEKKFGKSLEQLAAETLFKPLGMIDTHYIWANNMDENRYAVESDKDGQPMKYEKSSTVNAAANLLTTVSDYGKFLAYIANGAGLSPELYQQFITSQTSVKPGIGWGLGMQVYPDLPGNEMALSHTGGDDGIKCIAIVFPKSKRGLIILSNSENGMRVWKKIVGEYFGDTGREIVRRNLQ